MSKHRVGGGGIVTRPPARVRPAPRRGPQESVRAAAARVVARTLAARSPVDGVLAPALQPFDERDQALLRELVLGTLRWLRRIDQVIASASHRAFPEIAPPLRAPLRVAAYQLLFLDRVPAHAVVDEAVEQALHLTHRGGASFVNAVLRRIARSPRLGDWPVEEADPLRRLAIECSHPDFLVRRWADRFGLPTTRRLVEANNRPRPLHLLAFRDRGGRELLAEALIDEGLEVQTCALSPLGLTVRAGNPLATDAFRRGEFYLQDEASQAAALVPPPAAGERVLDAASAPGGKAFALVAWEPAARLLAADLSLQRALVLRSNLQRLGRCMPIAVTDASRPGVGGGFDRVVLDLPCTGTGTLRRNPELKWRIDEAEIGRLAAQAVRMLAGVAPLVRSGGLLAAITCSLEPEENEEVVTRFLACAPDFAPVDLEPLLPAPFDRHVAGAGLWRVMTGGEHDGFTVQVLRRG